MVYNTDEKKKTAAPAYQPSETVKQAQNAVQTQLSQKPGQYQPAWQGKMNETADKILNRQPFSYNVNDDALYQQYVDQYANQGKMAMMDTMGQAQAMTGGYGNSYAQMAGQQAYQGYMQQLNDKIPDLYQLALQQYTQQGQELYDQYAMLAAQEQQNYGRYRDSMSDYYAELQNLYGRLDAERSYDYDQYLNDRNYQYQVGRDQVADSQWKQNFQYQQGRDQIADQQWQQQYDEALRQWNESFGYQQDRDAVSDQQWKDSFQYQQDRDKVSDEQWQKQYEEALRQWQAEYDEDVRRFDYANGLGEFAPAQGSGGGTGGSGVRNPVKDPENEIDPMKEKDNEMEVAVKTLVGSISPVKPNYKTDVSNAVNKMVDEALKDGEISKTKADSLKSRYSGVFVN